MGRRRLLPVLLVAAALLASLPSGALARSCGGSGPATTLCLLNGQRAAHGLRPLRPDRRLAAAALGHARDMVAQRYFAHVSPSGEGLLQRVARTGWLRRRSGWMLGETLAWGEESLGTPAAIVAAWMRSPPHRDIVLRPGFRRVGIAVVAGTPVASGNGATVAADFGAGSAR